MEKSESNGVFDTSIARRLAAVKREKKELEAKVKTLSEQEFRLRQQCLRQFINCGTSNWRDSKTGDTHYIHRQTWLATAEGSTPEQLAKALQESGFEELISPNWSAFSSWGREQISERPMTEDADEIQAKAGKLEIDITGEIKGLPDALKPHVRVVERYDVRVRQGTGSKE